MYQPTYVSKTGRLSKSLNKNLSLLNTMASFQQQQDENIKSGKNFNNIRLLLVIYSRQHLDDVRLRLFLHIPDFDLPQLTGNILYVMYHTN